jgi:hypothetical protein
MYAAMAFLAKTASDFANTQPVPIMPATKRKPLVQGILSRDSPLTRLTLDNIFYQEFSTDGEIAFGNRT